MHEEILVVDAPPSAENASVDSAPVEREVQRVRRKVHRCPHCHSIEHVARGGITRSIQNHLSGKQRRTGVVLI